MNKTRRYVGWLGAISIVALIGSLLLPNPLIAFADEGTPPSEGAPAATETAPSSEDAAATADESASTDSSEEEAAPAAEAATEATAEEATDKAATTEEAASCDPTTADCPVVEEPLAEIVEALAEAEAVLVDENGEPIPLASEEAVEALSVADPFVIRGGVTYRFLAVGGCAAFPGDPNCTESATPIQAAIDFANAGETVTVEAGTYIEQIVIGKSLTVTGAGAATTTIQAPATLAPDANGQRSIVSIIGAGITVNFSGFTVSGPGPGGCLSIDFGIFVGGGATANIHDNTIADVRDDPFSGCQNGVGIRVGRNLFGSVGTATIDNNVIKDYQKNGITVDGPGSSATITNNTVTGAGPTATIAQNGIQISRGATGTIDNNTITGNNYTPNTWASTGILLYQAGNGVQVTNNTVGGTGNSANQTNVYVQESNNVTISNNTITDSTLDGIDIYLVNGATVTGNTIANAGYDGIWIGNSQNVSITSNTFTNNGNGAVADADPNAGGIHVANGSDPTTIVATNNRFLGNKNGVSNESNLAGSVDATNNWWGCAGGPGTAGCDTVSANVTFAPFLTGDPDPDGDNVFNPGDNCPNVANPGQADSNGNGVGDACEPPPAGGGGAGDGVGGALPAGLIIPVTGGEQVPLSGVSSTTLLLLPGGDQVTFTPGAGDAGRMMGSLTRETELTLPASLPIGNTFVSGMTFNATQGGVSLTTLPAGATLTVSFVIPPAFVGQTFAILYWDPTANGGRGGWAEVPATVTPDGRVVATVNLTGTFVLVAR